MLPVVSNAARFCVHAAPPLLPFSVEFARIRAKRSSNSDSWLCWGATGVAGRRSDPVVDR